ncbi:serine--tRNA ligase, partial [candidate division WWE3 bacterium RBG_16_37_10]
MLDIKYIRENPEVVKKGVIDKQLSKTIDIDKLLELDAKYLDLLRKVEIHRSLRNKLSEDISKVEGAEREKLIKEATGVKTELADMETHLKDLKTKIDEMLLWVPNPPAEDVPVGENDEGNVVVRKEGIPAEFSFTPKEHLDLGTELGIIDTERGAKVAGFRGYYLKGDGAMLEQALLKYAIDFMVEKGFELMSVPAMVKPEFFTGTGYFPWGDEDHYKTQDDMALIGTAEVPLTAYYAGEVLNEDDLPIKFVGRSPGFRREIGSYGKDTKGVFRVHQIDKVEQVVLLPADEKLSIAWHEKMLGNAEELLKSLGIAYQVVLMCSGDMGAGQRKKYDIESYFPGQNKYRETHSDSYFLDFQARRLNIKYKAKDGTVKYVYTLNNTVAASPRLLACIIENYQQEDGTILVPEVLQKYM